MPVLATKGSDELTTNVPHNLKQNIVAGEYIDISLLFVNSMSSSNDSQKITFVQGELIIQPKQSHPKINSIEVWTDAFMVALSVFGSALPETFHELLKHMYLIRLGAKRSTLGWKSYDEQFRLRTSQNPSLSLNCGLLTYMAQLVIHHSAIKYINAMLLIIMDNGPN